jgi:hypothetical protein
MKHLKKFNESESESKYQVTDEEKEIITKLEKLHGDKDLSRTQRTLIKKVISQIKSGELKKN